MPGRSRPRRRARSTLCSRSSMRSARPWAATVRVASSMACGSGSSPTTRARGTASQNAHASSATPTPTSRNDPPDAAPNRSARPSSTGMANAATMRPPIAEAAPLRQQDLLAECSPAGVGRPPERRRGGLTKRAADAVGERPRPVTEGLRADRRRHEPVGGLLEESVRDHDPPGGIVVAQRHVHAARQDRGHRAQHPRRVGQFADPGRDLRRRSGSALDQSSADTVVTAFARHSASDAGQICLTEQGSGGRARTCDIRLQRPVFYLLNYPRSDSSST